ncbi:LTA synthase family protein [Psychrobacillus sp. PGGUH221]|uniref:LTA synthase family protein n=1 Tax=Psychrobacillus sp. PGGUH221 TaxID=3020058 RepID=UPI0035C6A078
MDQVYKLLPVLYKEVSYIWIIIFSLLILITISLVIKFTSFKELNWVNRISLFTISLTIILTLCYYPYNFVQNIFSNSGIFAVPENQVNNQNINGIVLGFIINVPNAILESPNQYSKDILQDKIVSKYSYADGILGNEHPKIKPNIVVIMSESFWDIGNISEEVKRMNYIPTIEENKKGYIVSSQFGGGTANVEFEALTSLSINLLPKGSIPYAQYIKKETPSLASILSQHGYYTVGIHTFGGDFWNRNVVYPLLGFKEFIAYENLENPQQKGDFIADSEITNLIISELKNNLDPTFIYAITMQNHGGYNNERYGTETIEVPGNYSEDGQRILNTYATGVADADLELKRLIEYLNSFGEPTLVIFFGDHLPTLSDVYQESGFVGKPNTWELEDELKMKQTPLAVWNNYSMEIPNVGSISPSFLAPKILEWSSLSLPSYYSFINEFSEVMPGYTYTVKLDSKGNLFEYSPESLRKLEDYYKLIQYDILFGEQYSKEMGFFELN